MFFAPPEEQDCSPLNCRTYYGSYKIIVSGYDSIHFSLSFSACFWKDFAEPGAAPPLYAESSGTKVLCSTSRFLCWYFFVLTLMSFEAVRYSFRAGFARVSYSVPQFLCFY